MRSLPAMCLIALSAFVSAAHAEAPNPREATVEIAQAIEDIYFDPAKAKAIADDLRGQAAAGAYDRLTDPRDLANTLTDRLQPLDRHFHVQWVGDMPPPDNGPRSGAGGQPAPAPPSRDDADRRGNYGFRKIEIRPGNVAVVDMRSFADFQFGKPDEPARLAVDAMLRSVSNADAIILDLARNNGGSPAMVGYLASAFLTPGADVYNVFHGRDGTESESPKEPYATPMTDVPLFVVISGRTGSAGEALPYTLQAAKRATITGQHSAGAANPGGGVRLGSGFEIFISMGSPINAVTGTNWEGTGVKPDIELPLESALEQTYAMALKAIIANAPAGARTEAEWALEAATTADIAFDPSDYVGQYDAVAIQAADGRLVLRRGERPAMNLRALKADLFTVVDDPARRVQFERDAAGHVVALESLNADGDRLHLKRTS